MNLPPYLDIVIALIGLLLSLIPLGISALLNHFPRSKSADTYTEMIRNVNAGLIAANRADEK